MSATRTHAGVQVMPNVTPMIDVMLVLLIVLMVWAPVLIAGLRAVPPMAVNLTAHPEDPGDYTLGIDAQGRYFLQKVMVTPASLDGGLRALFAARPQDRVLYLRADRAVRYAVVRDAMDRAARSGARVVALIAEQPNASAKRH